MNFQYMTATFFVHIDERKKTTFRFSLKAVFIC